MLQQPLSPAGQKLLSEITKAGDDWFTVRRLYEAYTGAEVQIFNAVMHIAIRCEQFKEGARIYKRLSALNIAKTAPTFTAALKVFAQLGQNDTVRKLWREAADSIPLDQPLALARIDAAAAEGDVETAATVLDTMEKASVEVNIAHVTSAIRACWEANGTNWRAAQYLFNLSLVLDLQPAVPTFSCLIGAYATAPITETLAAYRTMQELGVEADKAFVEIYLSTVLDLRNYQKRSVVQLASYLRRCSAERLSAARAALHDFQSAGVELSILSDHVKRALRLLGAESEQ